MLHYAKKRDISGGNYANVCKLLSGVIAEEENSGGGELTKKGTYEKLS